MRYVALSHLCVHIIGFRTKSNLFWSKEDICAVKFPSPSVESWHRGIVVGLKDGPEEELEVRSSIVILWFLFSIHAEQAKCRHHSRNP